MGIERVLKWGKGYYASM